MFFHNHVLSSMFYNAGPNARRPFLPSVLQSDIDKHYHWAMQAIDLNKDEELDLSEIVHYFKEHPNGAWGRDIRYHQGYAFGRVQKYYRLYGAQINEALIVSIANDTMVYHDLNDDEIITKEELMASLVQWHGVKSRLHKVTYLVLAVNMFC